MERSNFLALLALGGLVFYIYKKKQGCGCSGKKKSKRQNGGVPADVVQTKPSYYNFYKNKDNYLQFSLWQYKPTQ